MLYSLRPEKDLEFVLGVRRSPEAVSLTGVSPIPSDLLICLRFIVALRGEALQRWLMCCLFPSAASSSARCCPRQQCATTNEWSRQRQQVAMCTTSRSKLCPHRDLRDLPAAVLSLLSFFRSCFPPLRFLKKVQPTFPVVIAVSMAKL